MTINEMYGTLGLEVPELLQPENVRITRVEIALEDVDFERLLKSGLHMNEKSGSCAPDEVELLHFIAVRRGQLNID